MSARLREMSRVRLWLFLLPVVAAGCLAIGITTGWSANGVAAVIAVALAYLAVPPMVVALLEWQAHRGQGADAAKPAVAAPDERFAVARAERSRAFRELWEIVQEAHIGVRNNFDKAYELAEVHRRLNILLIEKAPALDHSDVELAHDFLDALGTFIRRLRPMPGASAEQIREDIATTARRPRLINDVVILRDVYAQVLECNAALEKRYQEIVFGER